MSRRGDNLPEFRSVQLDFAAHIRNPEVNPQPADVESRRMQVYVDLFFNNIKNFLDSTFPVARKVLGEQRWRELAREFVHKHPSESPYFLQISEEFLTFLHERGLQDLPPFLLELCHYEWVELSLDVAADVVGTDAHGKEAQGREAQGKEGGDEAVGDAIVSPHVRMLVYRFPVHQISADHQPREPGKTPTYLVAYRTPELHVRFMESNPLTHRLLELLSGLPQQQAIAQIAQELAEAGQNVPLAILQEQGNQIITHFREAGIIA
jgi:hypothetical protein